MEKHLKPYQYYSDQYDHDTVEECRWWINQRDNQDYINKEAKTLKVTVDEARAMVKCVEELSIYFISGERYINKSSTIRKWEERDKARDELLENAMPPDPITCLTCGRLMLVSYKDLDFGGSDSPDRVMFMYDCPLGHLPRRMFYHTGEEWRCPAHKCPKCKSEFKKEAKREEDKKIIIKYVCDNCNYTENDEIDLTNKVPEEEKIDPNFESDRQRFCLSEEDGIKYIDGKDRLESISKLMEDFEEREKHKKDYDKVASLRRLKITELEELLTPILEKADYIKLQFKDPEMNKDVFLPFIVYDKQVDRSDRESELKLKKLLDKTLEDTNWRLMSEGVNYRLGMLSGRLRGYEREEDLVKIIQLKLKRS